MERVDELVARGRRLGEDAQPAERIDPLVDCQHAGRNRRTADAVKSVAAGDEVAVDLVFGIAMPESDHRAGRVERADRHVLGLEVQRTRGRRPRFDQVVDDFVLPVDGDRLAAGQLGEIDAMAPPLEADVERRRAAGRRAASPAPTPIALQQIDGALLEDARPHAIDDVLAAAVLDDDRVDAVEMQQVSEQQPCRTCADDADLSPHLRASVSLRFQCRISDMPLGPWSWSLVPSPSLVLGLSFVLSSVLGPCPMSSANGAASWQCSRSVKSSPAVSDAER